ncbi:MAG: hypothetical protein Q8Q08_01000 [Candidatus Omnitrophota bacterium]|nr:hypothetical protein [Candidatus Omnitrophota bacterium]MDZ4242566.1 hypothetical protein [Candidatus Omnitrophota bacterium]
MDLSASFNLCEGLLWLGLAGLFYKVKVFKKQPDKKADHLFAVLLILFGISDFVEMRAGAWWEPKWLLAWKVVNFAAMGAVFIKSK